MEILNDTAVNFISDPKEEDLNEHISSSTSVNELRSHIHKYQIELLTKYYDMSYISSIADDSFVLSAPIKAYTGVGLFPEKRKNQFAFDIVFVREHNKLAQKIGTKLEQYVNLKSILFKQIRQIYPDFCLNLENKIEENQLTLYRKARKNLRAAIFYDDPYSIDTQSNIVLNKLRDDLSQVIDSKSFIEACLIEDCFVLSELETFSNLLSKLPSTEKNYFLSQKIPLTNEFVDMKTLLEKFKSEISTRISLNLETLKLYNKISTANEIKLTIKNQEQNREETR